MKKQGTMGWLVCAAIAAMGAGCSEMESIDEDVEEREDLADRPDLFERMRNDSTVKEQIEILEEEGWLASWDEATTERVALPPDLAGQAGEAEVDRVSVPMSKTDSNGEIVERADLLYMPLASGGKVALAPQGDAFAERLSGADRNVVYSAAHVEHCYDNGVAGHRFKVCLHYDPGNARGAWVDGYTDWQYRDVGVKMDLLIGHGDDLTGGDWINALGGSRRVPGAAQGRVTVDWNRYNDHRAAWVKSLGACVNANENGRFIERCAPSIPVAQWGCLRIASIGLDPLCYQRPGGNVAGAMFYVGGRSGPQNGLHALVPDARGGSIACPTPHRGERQVFVCGYPAPR